MPVELSIVESVTELETTVVTVVLESASAPGPAGPGVPVGGTDGQVLTKTSATDYATAWEDPTGGGGGAPTDADYLVGTAHGDLSAEIVVGTSPGGELGGTWATPTVDAVHSGSSHASVQAAAEATAAAALSAHEADTTSVHGIADTSALALTANHPSNATFNDHSARHEDGGADEISLTGLSGTPAALTTHEADTTNIHGIADTSALALTANHPTNATFNDHSARHEDGGADEISIQGLAGTPLELTNHLNDAADAHDASAISVLDTAGDYTATDVEGVLAEIAPQLGGGVEKIFDTTLGADAATIDTGAAGVPSGFAVIEIWILIRGTQVADFATCGITFNADTGNNYEQQILRGSNVTASASISQGQPSIAVGIPGASAEAGAAAAIDLFIPAYDQTTFHKAGVLIAAIPDDTAANWRVDNRGFRWKSTAAVTRITATASTGNFLAGSRMVIYGRV